MIVALLNKKINQPQTQGLSLYPQVYTLKELSKSIPKKKKKKKTSSFNIISISEKFQHYQQNWIGQIKKEKKKERVRGYLANQI